MTCRYPYCDAGEMGAFCKADCQPAPTQPTVQRTLTDEVIAELWHKNGGFHHHFARHIERWLKGGA